MAKKYQPMAIGLIDEGRFVQQANADLLDMQARLLRFVREHQKEAKGAKATLTIQISLSVDDVKNEIFGVKSLTKTSLPNRPATITQAIADQTAEGEDSLFVRASGSDADTPRQSKLCTDDGRKIDTETGEVLQDSTQ